jgi:hypothetical protein
MASPDQYGQNVAHESMNRASHISNLQPSRYLALGRGMGFGKCAQLVEMSASAQAGAGKKSTAK